MSTLRRLARNRIVRTALVIIILVVTFSLFAYYLVNNPKTIQSVITLQPLTLLLLSVAYVTTILANAFVLWASLKMIKKPLGFMENVALTGYSSIVNFFGPLQSGPGFRAAYLKKRHSVSIKNFFYLTILFYFVFAVVNGAVITIAFIVNNHSAVSLLLLVSATLLVALLIWIGRSKLSRLGGILHRINLSSRYTWYVAAGAVLLSLATAFAYFIELRHVDGSISFWQTLIYAAAANLALFVSLTPGAIGFRESFLLLTERLHGINPDTVIAASIIDRAFYVVFLLVMFVVLLLFGFRSRLQNSRSRQDER